MVLASADSARPICADWAKISLGKYEVNNNVWGKEKIRHYSQCIYGTLNPQTGLPGTIGWSWDWPKVFDGIKAYPSVLYGRKPWNNYSTTSYLPQVIDKLKHVTVSYKIMTESDGAENLLLESWITRTDKPSSTDRVGELAVHLQQKNPPGQAGEYVETVVIGDIKFDFYYEKKMRVPGDSYRWAYYGFVHKGKPVLQAKVDMMQFVNYLITKGYLDPKSYLATVELGNEVDHGRGKTELQHFSVNVTDL